MLKKKCMAITIILAAVTFVMSGCTKKSNTYAEEYKGSYISLENNGEITVTYFEEFDEELYSKEELEQMAQEEAKEFNEKYSEDNGMSVKNVSVKDDKAKVTISFTNVDEYVLYNEKYVNSERELKMFVGTYDEAVAAGYKITGKLKEVGKKDLIDVEEVKDELSKLHVIYITQGIYIKVNGKVKYVNKNTTLKKAGVETSDKNQNYIFYEMEDK